MCDSFGVLSPPPLPSSIFRFYLSRCLSVTQSLAVSLLSARPISRVYARICISFFENIKVSFVDMYIDLLRIYKGLFFGCMQGAFSHIYVYTYTYIFVNLYNNSYVPICRQGGD